MNTENEWNDAGLLHVLRILSNIEPTSDIAMLIIETAKAAAHRIPVLLTENMQLAEENKVVKRESAATIAEKNVQISRLVAGITILREAMRRIERWHGEFPATGKVWEDGTPVSYAQYRGSNGERDYMRQVARDALEATAAAEQDTKDPDAIEHYDDGARVYLDGYSGGAAPEGLWGKLRLRFVDPNGNECFRTYEAATDFEPLTPEPADKLLDAYLAQLFEAFQRRNAQ